MKYYVWDVVKEGFLLREVETGNKLIVSPNDEDIEQEKLDAIIRFNRIKHDEYHLSRFGGISQVLEKFAEYLVEGKENIITVSPYDSTDKSIAELFSDALVYTGRQFLRPELFGLDNYEEYKSSQEDESVNNSETEEVNNE